MVEIGGADGVRMELDAAEVDDPGQAGGVVDDELFGGAAGGEGERDGAEPVGQVRRARASDRRARLLGAVDEALEDDGAVANAVQRAGGDGEEVADEVELGELHFAGEVEFSGLEMRTVWPSMVRSSAVSSLEGVFTGIGYTYRENSAMVAPLRILSVTYSGRAYT